MNISKKKKILLIRLDKIGDLISTLPVDQVLDPAIYDVTWIVQKGMLEIVKLGEIKRKAVEIDSSKPALAKSILKKVLFINSFDIVISFQSPWWVNFELFLAGVPKRIGPLSSWHSFLFLTEGLRQKRSDSIKHEFEYNLDLVFSLTGPVANTNLIFKFQKPNSSAILEKYNLNSRFVVVHPGMAGSALNWPQTKYIGKISELLRDHFTVVITGTESDAKYLDEIAPIVQFKPGVRWLIGKVKMAELVELIYYSEFVIAPSTGVAHIAASLGKKLFTVFSPVQVQRAIRWAPRGFSIEQVSIHSPDVVCPAKFKCLGKECPQFNCMESVEIAT